jgi:hypothetical protein
MDLETFKTFVKNERSRVMSSPYDLVYQSFEELGFHQHSSDYFLQNASYIVEELRRLNWEKFLRIEKNFSGFVYEQLIDENEISNMSKVDAIKWYVNEHTEYIYALSLSNTQSRRSRAGYEFETIIEMLLMGAEIPFDTQGSIGSGVFESTKLAKLVDCVSPGASEYKLDKRNTSLISAKTTLRERWQEVGDEMSRTMAREMYLATLDEGISTNVVRLIGQNNIILVTTAANKERLYNNSPYVMSFETMLEELKTKALVWSNYTYPDLEKQAKRERFSAQINNFSDKRFIVDYYQSQLELLN